MKVVSFDIGTRNLSFCVMSYDPEVKDTFEINKSEWIVVDIIKKAEKLMGILDEKHQCTALLKTGKKQCSRTNTVKINKDTIDSFINQYKSKKKCQLLQLLYENVNEEKKNKTEIINKLKEQLYDELLLNNDEVHLCTRHFNNKNIFFDFSTFKKKQTKKKKKVTDIDLNRALYAILNEHPILLEVAYVEIEQQMRKDMICVASKIEYHLTNYNKNLKELKYVNGFTKLCSYDGPAFDENCCRYNERQRRNKYFAIEMAKYFLKDYPDLLEYMTSHSKQDDLCDTFLYNYHKLFVEVYKVKLHIPFLDPDPNHQKIAKFRRRGNFKKYKKK